MAGRPINAARRAARSQGLRYYAGPECRAAHGGERYVSTGACVECVRARDRSRTHHFVDSSRKGA